MSTSPIAAMFDRISPKYDCLNHLLSLNIDKVWRRKTAKLVAKQQPLTILDLATGTADLAIDLAKHNPQAHIIGVDFSAKMLEIGKKKIQQQHLEQQIELTKGDAADLPFADNSFDTVTVAFGVRNFEDLDRSLSEISRITKSEGQVVILEFSMPERFPVKQLYRFYFKHILPRIGGTVSKDPFSYTYLPDSVAKFPKPDVFSHLLTSFNFENCKTKQLTMGIATLYISHKK